MSTNNSDGHFGWFPAKGESVKFSVANSASNKENRKVFPVCVHFLCLTVQCNLLDFYEDSVETADRIYKSLTSYLESSELDIENITSYSADNANVNSKNHILRSNGPV